MYKIIASCFLFVSLCGLAKPANQIQNIEALFENAVNSSTVPGINAAIADANGVVWAKGYGLADIENNVPMTSQHKMRIGSVAKLITVAGMMRLYEQGKLSLDALIGQYVPTWPKHHQAISLSQLASHTSGVRHYKDNAEFLLNHYFADTTASLALFKGDKLLFEPGAKHQYSTCAFTLIAAAMEGADKTRDFKQIIHQEVFAPLNMQDSVFDAQADIIAHRQRPYIARDGELFNAPQSDHSYKYAGGGFIATPSDISRFAVAHTNESYLTKASLHAMFNKANLKNGDKMPFGIGWMIDFDNYKNRTHYKNNQKAQTLMASFDNAVMHAGGSNGGTTMLILCRDHQRSITVVKNVDGDHSADVFLLALGSLALFHNDEKSSAH